MKNLKKFMSGNYRNRAIAILLSFSGWMLLLNASSQTNSYNRTIKNDSTSTKKKGLESFVANLFAKDNNPQNGVLRKNEIDQERDATKSFFYLLWKSVFAAAKKTVAGKTTE